jgi:hypothetical protein
MAARKKRIVKTVANEQYSELEMYCIWLHEYYNALLRAGFKSDIAMTVMMDKTSYPDWVEYKMPKEIDIQNYMDDEDED